VSVATKSEALRIKLNFLAYYTVKVTINDKFYEITHEEEDS